MGWWSDSGKTGEVILGDEPIDAAIEFLKRTSEVYRKAHGRRPTPAELSRTLQLALTPLLDTIFDSMEDKELGAIVIRFKRNAHRQKVLRGDYFAVPLPSGGYGYGRVKGVYMRSVLLLDFLKARSELLLDVADLRHVKVLFESVCGNKGLVTGDWPIMGHEPLPPEKSERTDEELINYHTDRLGGVMEGSESARCVLEWHLNGKKGRRPYAPEE